MFGGKVQRVGNIVLRLIGIKAARGIPFPFRWSIAPKNCSVLDWNLDQIPRKTLAILYRNFWKNARREWWKSKKVFFWGGKSPN